MARQYLVPGAGYLNETNLRQYLIPPATYVDDTVVSTAAATFTGSSDLAGYADISPSTFETFAASLQDDLNA